MTKRKRVLLNDGMDDLGVRAFRRSGFDTDTGKKTGDALREAVPDYDALVVRSATHVTEDVIEAGAKGRLKIVGRAGVGVDNIDVKAASEHGVVVKFAPYGNTNAAAELAAGLMLASARNIPQAHKSLQDGTWVKKPYRGTELSGATLAIVGCGRVGQRLANLLHGFDMRIIGCDANPDVVRSLYPDSPIKLMTPERALPQADYVSVHTAGTNVAIGEKEFSIMKPTARLVNTARGFAVDEEALYRALTEGRIAGAALDVYKNEPVRDGDTFGSRLLGLPNVVTTSHLGAETEAAQRRTSEEMAAAVAGYWKGDFSGAVNAQETVAQERRRTYTLFVYHKDEPGAFADIDRVLGDNGINIRDHPSRSLGNGDAMAVYMVHQPVTQRVLADLNRLTVVHYAKL